MSPTYTPGVVDGVEPPEEASPAFTATIYRLEEINLAVDVPVEVSDWFGERGNIPVYGTLDAVTIRATMVPTGGGRHRIYLNGPMREATATGEGDEVRMALWRDDGDRGPQLPDDLRAALEAADALDAFLAWPPSHQREYCRAIESVKRPETRARNVQRAVTEVLKRR